MKRERILPASREDWLALRVQDITSTEVPALFGLSPYSTEFQVWYQKQSGDIGEIAQTERMEIGLKLEEVIARTFAERAGIKIRKLNQYIRDPDIRLGASFDFEIIKHPKGPGLLEVKNVDSLVYRNTWSEENGEIEAPAHIEMQVAHQMAVTGRQWAMVAVLVGGNQLKGFIRNEEPEITMAIRKKVAQFWESIRSNLPPKPDFNRDSGYLIKRMYGVSAEGIIADRREDDELQFLADRYHQASQKATALDAEKKAIKAEILTLVGDAEVALLPKGKLSLKTVKEAQIPATTRSGYRGFRYTPAKPPKE